MDFLIDRFGADLQGVHGSNFKSEINALTVNTAPIQLKFAVPMQYGFDGDNPSVEKKTGGDTFYQHYGI